MAITSEERQDLVNYIEGRMCKEYRPVHGWRSRGPEDSNAAASRLRSRIGDARHRRSSLVIDTFEERPWFWEGNVQGSLAAHLAGEGWEVREAADTESKAPGIDLLATKEDRWLAIEVKSYPNTTYDHGPKRGQPKPTQPPTQARQRFSHALLGMMMLRHKRPDAEIAICFPRFKTYESLVERTAVSFRLLGFGVYFVRQSGSVDLALPHDPVAPVDRLSRPARSVGSTRRA